MTLHFRPYLPKRRETRIRRTSAKLHKLRGDLHDKRGEREQALAEYEHALRLQPNNRRLISAIGDWYEAATPKGDSQNEKALAFHDEALPKLVMANQSKTEADPGMGSTAFGFAKFYDEQGDAEKCWQAFQIAMENDPYGRSSANRAKRMTDRFSTIRDVSAFKAFREAPETAGRDRSQDGRIRERGAA